KNHSQSTSSTNGIANTAVGSWSGYENLTGNYNTIMGYSALKNNKAGSGATAIGYQAMLYANNTSTGFPNYNVALGFEALRGSTNAENNTGNYNTATGYKTLWTNTTGHDNTANGYQSLYSNQTGDNNASFGSYALSANYSGSGNTAVGEASLISNYSGSCNTATGFLSLWNNYDGISNTATGYNSLNGNTDGTFNTANGTNALIANSHGDYNTASGAGALTANQTGNNNTADGYYALYADADASNNTAVGYYALSSNDGDYNTAIGAEAGHDNATYDYSTFAGYGAIANGNYSNATAVGNGAIVYGSDRIELGDANTSTNGVFTPGGLYSGSDGRFKYNIQENVKGLEFIKKLRPVIYQMETKLLTEFVTQNLADSIRSKYIDSVDFTASRNKIHSGFIAQEVDSVAQICGYTSSIVHEPSNSTDIYSLNYAEIVVPLVKAVQELSKTVDSLKTIIAGTGMKIMNDNNDNTQNAETVLQIQLANDIVLYQNEPNPFGETTVIRYYIPDNLTTNVYMVFYDFYGKEVKKVEIKEKGSGKIEADTKNLSVGIYTYSLVIDGTVRDTKKMVKE
ncbi:MAG: tail fiber domain-containing protein, partial [Bacteroidota bacterium]